MDLGRVPRSSHPGKAPDAHELWQTQEGAVMVTLSRTLVLSISLLAWASLGTVGPAWGQCDVKSADPDCPQRPLTFLKDEFFQNPNGKLGACAPDDGFCVGVLLSNQDGVTSKSFFVEGQPQGAIGTRGTLRVRDAPGVLCACPGGPGNDQGACGFACLMGFASGTPHESQRASCQDCARLEINAMAREDVEVDHDGDPETPPVGEPLAYVATGTGGLVKATGASGQECTVTLVLDEIFPAFDFSHTLENNDHGTVTKGCL